LTERVEMLNSDRRGRRGHRVHLVIQPGDQRPARSVRDDDWGGPDRADDDARRWTNRHPVGGPRDLTVGGQALGEDATTVRRASVLPRENGATGAVAH